jgi:hypothetical protein
VDCHRRCMYCTGIFITTYTRRCATAFLLAEVCTPPFNATDLLLRLSLEQSTPSYKCKWYINSRFRNGPMKSKAWHICLSWNTYSGIRTVFLCICQSYAWSIIVPASWPGCSTRMHDSASKLKQIWLRLHNNIQLKKCLYICGTAIHLNNNDNHKRTLCSLLIRTVRWYVYMHGWVYDTAGKIVMMRLCIGRYCMHASSAAGQHLSSN